MQNAQEELLHILEGTKSVIKCAYIKCERGSYWDDNDSYVQPAPILLKEGYTLKNGIDDLPPAMKQILVK